MRNHLSMRTITLGDRFWSKVDKRGPDECWNWKGSKTNFGHGKFSWGHSNWIPSHRVAFMLSNGRWPEGDLSVCHKCDNPACNNGSHLFEGTAKDNARDASAKGRMSKPHPSAAGEGNSQAKLTWEIVNLIRSERELHNTSFGCMAKKHGISKRTILSIVHNETWKI